MVKAAPLGAAFSLFLFAYNGSKKRIKRISFLRAVMVLLRNKDDCSRLAFLGLSR